MRKPPTFQSTTKAIHRQRHEQPDLSRAFGEGGGGGVAHGCLGHHVGDRPEAAFATFFGGASMAPQAAAIEGGLTAAGDADIRSRRLADQLRNLSEDRDRLLARVTVLERNYEDATGTVGRLQTAADVAPAAPAPVQPASRTAVLAPDSIEGLLTKTEFGVDLGGAPALPPCARCGTAFAAPILSSSKGLGR